MTAQGSTHSSTRGSRSPLAGNKRRSGSSPVQPNQRPQVNQPANQHKRRVQMFALVWMSLTLIVGALAFAAVYMTTGVVSARAMAAARQGVPPSDDQAAVALAMQITATRFPTFPPETAATLTPIYVIVTEGPSPTTPAQATIAPAEPNAIAGGPTPTLIAVNDTKFDMGIAVQKNVDAGVYKIWVDNVRDSIRLNWVKSQVIWRDTERVKGQYDWAEMDVAINQLYDANIRVLLSITKAPDWARDPGAPTDQPGVFDGPPANPQDFVDFVNAILTRYPSKISAIEVWNEINLDREWSTAPKAISATRYVTLLQAAYTAIKAADPNILVISSALAPTGAQIPGVATDDFVHMQALITAGMLNYTDCVGAHHNGINVPPDSADWRNLPERSPPAKYRGPWSNPDHSWSFRATLEGYHERIVAAGENTPLCLTEFGWPSVEGLTGNLRPGFEYAYDNSLQDQADFTDRAIKYMQGTGWVQLAFLWNLNYGPQAGWDISGPVGDNVPWSIFGPGYERRPVMAVVNNYNFRGQAR